MLPCQTLGTLNHNALVDKQPTDAPNDVLVRIDVQQLQLIRFVRAKRLHQRCIIADNLLQAAQTFGLLLGVRIEEKLSRSCFDTGNTVELDGVAEHAQHVFVKEAGMCVGAGLDIGLDGGEINGFGDAFKVLGELALGGDAEFGGDELAVGI